MKRHASRETLEMFSEIFSVFTPKTATKNTYKFVRINTEGLKDEDCRLFAFQCRIFTPKTGLHSLTPV